MKRWWQYTKTASRKFWYGFKRAWRYVFNIDTLKDESFREWIDRQI